MNNHRTNDPGFTKLLLPSGRGSSDFEPERNVAQTLVSGIGLDLKSQFPAHFNTRG
jgi:hypothetical protein